MPVTQEQVDAEIKLIEDCQFIAAVVRNEVEKAFGWRPGDTIISHHKSRGPRVFFRLGAPDNYGIFSSIIKKAYVEVFFDPIRDANTMQNLYWISVSLDYEHHRGGRNGHTMYTIWVDPKTFKVVDTRKEGE